jgi:hypothetical protein
LKELAKLLNKDDIRNIALDKSSTEYMDWYNCDIMIFPVGQQNTVVVFLSSIKLKKEPS